MANSIMQGEKHTEKQMKEQSCELFMHILASAAIKPQNPKGKNKSIYLFIVVKKILKTTSTLKQEHLHSDLTDRVNTHLNKCD